MVAGPCRSATIGLGLRGNVGVGFDLGLIKRDWGGLGQSIDKGRERGWVGNRERTKGGS